MLFLNQLLVPELSSHFFGAPFLDKALMGPRLCTGLWPRHCVYMCSGFSFTLRMAACPASTCAQLLQLYRAHGVVGGRAPPPRCPGEVIPYAVLTNRCRIYLWPLCSVQGLTCILDVGRVWNKIFNRVQDLRLSESGVRSVSEAPWIELRW